jgi:hypothetical protein
MELVKQRLSRLEIDKDPNLLWNRFIAILAQTAPDHPSPAHRRFSLVFWYESEVQNGGHLQFFLNRPQGSAEATVEALQSLRADAHATVLAKAIEIWNENNLGLIRDAEDYITQAKEGKLESLDGEFYGLRPTLINLLEAALESNTEEFFDFDVG